jgi:hypothetical protein
VGAKALEGFDSGGKMWGGRRNVRRESKKRI